MLSAQEILSPLNDSQAKAVSYKEGPLLVLAGAGTGKTKTLTSRVAYLISQNIYPSQLLVVTFTNKAAGEMKHRVAALLNQPVDGMWIGTFHSIAARILRKHATNVGLRNDFTIIDSDDQLRLLKQLLKDHNIDEKRHPAKQLAYVINGWKDKGLTPAMLQPSDAYDFADGHGTQLYHEYQQRLLSLNAADFGDLLLYNLILFKEYPALLHDYSHKFRHILVDEYQDTNVAQYLWLRLLASAHHNICCVGDDDQSIYGWRGAEVGHILKFEQDFTGASIIRLERNYRSTTHILNAAGALISHNKNRLGKTLWTEDNQGSPVQVNAFFDDIEEANAIADNIDKTHFSHSIDYSNIAILVRASYQTRTFEECFIARGLPYKVIGGLRFYERKEIKDVIAFLRIVHQPYDLLAFERIANAPKRGVGPTTIQRIIHTSRAENLNIIDTIHTMLSQGSLKGKAQPSLQTFIQQLQEWQSLSSTVTLEELCQRIMDDTGYIQALKIQNNAESQSRIENIKELFSSLNDFETLEVFLDHVSLVMDTQQSDNTDMINIMTLHAAKGLEFDTVFLPGWEQGIFPNQRALDDAGEKALEEERRLAYVGITRAKRHAEISFASRRRMFGSYQYNLPSCFVEELPEEHIAINQASPTNTTHATKHYNDNHGHSFDQGPSIEADFNQDHHYGGLNVGSRVFHLKFGYGKILRIDGDKLDIAFEKSGRKTVIASYVDAA